MRILSYLRKFFMAHNSAFIQGTCQTLGSSEGLTLKGQEPKFFSEGKGKLREEAVTTGKLCWNPRVVPVELLWQTQGVKAPSTGPPDSHFGKGVINFDNLKKCHRLRMVCREPFLSTVSQRLALSWTNLGRDWPGGDFRFYIRQLWLPNTREPVIWENVFMGPS